MSVASRLSMRRVSDCRCGDLGRLTMGAFYAKAPWGLAGDAGEPKRDANTMSRATASLRALSKFAGFHHEGRAMKTMKTLHSKRLLLGTLLILGGACAHSALATQASDGAMGSIHVSYADLNLATSEGAAK